MRVLFFCSCLLLLLVSGGGAEVAGSNQAAVSGEVPLRIEFWYGDVQQAWLHGGAQPLVNVLGSVTPREQAGDVWYRVNGGPRAPLMLGPDLHRLVRPGDFNIEIDRAALLPGRNTVTVGVHDLSGRLVSREVWIDCREGRRWEIPCEIDFAAAANVQDAVEVIDGRWALTPDGLRTVEPGYDRQVAFGDGSWSDYELEAEILFHQLLPDLDGREADGPPYLSHAHTSFNLRWRGHPDDGFRPRRDWMELGSLVALRWDQEAAEPGGVWWLHFGRGASGEEKGRSILDRRVRHQVSVGGRYLYRMRVETLPDGGARYSAKVWRADGEEPPEWQVQGIDGAEALGSGSVVFVVHHSDVTLCRVRVGHLGD